MNRRQSPQYDEDKKLIDKKVKLDICYPSNLNLMAKRVMMISSSPFLIKDVSKVIGLMMYLSDFKTYFINYLNCDRPLLLNPYESILNATHVIIKEYKMNINNVIIYRKINKCMCMYPFYPWYDTKKSKMPINQIPIEDDRLYLK